MPLLASGEIGEVYSETNYIPQYGFISETKINLFLAKSETSVLYTGGALQAQGKTNASQDQLFEKNRIMAVFGLRHSIWKNLMALLEFRTEDRSRGGLFVGDFWQYQVNDLNLFSEIYAESLILPNFDSSPISTVWYKQGVRYSLSKNLLFDPFVELYLRHSPNPDLGRTTEQARIGLRTTYLKNKWTVSALIYQSYGRNEVGHVEGLLVIGGTF